MLHQSDTFSILYYMLLIPIQWKSAANQFLYPPEYQSHFSGLVLSHEKIRARIRELAALLHQHCQVHARARPLLVCTLKGACTFFVHLTEELQLLRQGFDVEFVRAKSYVGTESSGAVRLLLGQEDADGLEVLEHFKGRHVVLVEDILDTGTTLEKLVPVLHEKGQPASIQVVTLLDKRLKDGTEKKFKADFIGFSIPDVFIIGYGLDYNELYRDLRDIFVISQAGIEFDAKKLHDG